MCLIIDVNVASDFVGPKPAAVPVLKWLLGKGGHIALGGKLADEYRKSTLRGLWAELSRKGSVKLFKDNLVDAEQQTVEDTKLCKSDDPHIIALARLSGCRLVFTRDKPLHADFKNKDLINKPRGFVYTDDTHAPLLVKCPACKDPL